VVLEAQLSGLPVISTFHAGIPEVVLNGETGLLSQEGDVEGLASALMRISREPRLAARLGSAGRERVKAEFTLAHHVDIVAAVLRQQVNSAKTASFSKFK
jgi:glycosyltransferase involved in cell wall biosynthesis